MDAKERELIENVKAASQDVTFVKMRHDLASFTAQVFGDAGTELQAIGHMFGSHRVNGESPNQNGDDDVYAIGLLMRIAGQLLSASNDLFADGRQYAAAALLRQLVEVEYLAWAFETRDKDAQKWLRSTYQERKSFFTPAKLRDAAGGKFQGRDYGHHCELGGHPVPRAAKLFKGDIVYTQMMLVDMLGHVGRTWAHLLGWAGDNEWSAPIRNRKSEMHSRFDAWNSTDPLVAAGESWAGG